jgi:hypothetical protein
MEEKFECELEKDEVVKKENVISAIFRGKTWYCTYRVHPMFMSRSYVDKKGCLTKEGGFRCRYLRMVW